MAYTSPGAKSLHTSMRNSPGMARPWEACPAMGINKSDKECRLKIALFRMRARRIRHGRNGMVSLVSKLTGELFEHADYGMCWIMASVIGDDACCTIGCTNGKGCT
eukprot:362139-Chlamydomonas_euryale.AAC.9